MYGRTPWFRHQCARWCILAGGGVADASSELSSAVYARAEISLKLV